MVPPFPPPAPFPLSHHNQQMASPLSPPISLSNIDFPPVLRDDAHARWVMVFQASNLGGDNDRAQIKLAVSQDLYSWRRFPKDAGGLLFTDICVARDPQLVAPAAEYGDVWTM